MVHRCHLYILFLFPTCDFVVAGLVELSHVELKADDGEHEDGHEQKQADLQQGDHGLHNGLQYHLQAWRTRYNMSTQEELTKESIVAACLCHRIKLIGAFGDIRNFDSC